MDSSILKPASELAGTNKAHFPNESVDYRRARQDLLTKEIELRVRSSLSLNCAGRFRPAAR